MDFNLSFLTYQVLIATLLISTRISGAFMSAPIISRREIPTIAKIGLIAIISICLYPIASTYTNNIMPTNIYILVIFILWELLLGLIVGTLINLIFDSMATFAQLGGNQLGMNSAATFDPSVSASLNPFGNYMMYSVNLIFLSLNGLWLVILLINKTFELLPLGQIGFDLGHIFENFIDIIDAIFKFSLEIFLPFIGLMFLLDILITLIAKILPQANMFFLFIPSKIIVASGFLLLIMNGLWINLDNFLNEQIFDYFNMLFAIN